MKPYLLIGGDHYYPSSGTKDWIKCFETKEEAESFITHYDAGLCKHKLQDGSVVDWYVIVDLKKWTEADEIIFTSCRIL